LDESRSSGASERVRRRVSDPAQCKLARCPTNQWAPNVDLTQAVAIGRRPRRDSQCQGMRRGERASPRTFLSWSHGTAVWLDLCLFGLPGLARSRHRSIARLTHSIEPSPRHIRLRRVADGGGRKRGQSL
jgi:hypothetical protein